jgi:hypothetical protein
VGGWEEEEEEEEELACWVQADARTLVADTQASPPGRAHTCTIGMLRHRARIVHLL